MWNHDKRDGVGIVVAGQLAIAAAPFQQISVNSAHSVDVVTGDASQCYDWSPNPPVYDVGVLDFVDLYSTLGVQPPFRVE